MLTVTVTQEQRNRYITLIDELLKKGDLSTITPKQIRKAMQEELGYDISEQKVNFCTSKLHSHR